MGEMIEVAEKFGHLVDGRVDLRSRRVRFDHSDLDLRRFLLTGADLSGSKLANCRGEEADFRGCVLRDFSLEAIRPRSFIGADFSESQIVDSSIGGAPLDLTGVKFAHAHLRRVEFMLARLAGADFSYAELTDVTLRGANLQRASFCNSTLERVSLEKASLYAADFSGAVFRSMEHWGEPEFEGAVISDELRYQFGVVGNPVERLAILAESSEFSREEQAAIARLRNAVAEFVGTEKEAMLIASEFEDLIPRGLFTRVLKRLKAMQL